jgi:hypothetical protein
MIDGANCHILHPCLPAEGIGPPTTRNMRRISTIQIVKLPKGSQRRVQRLFRSSSSSPSNAADANTVGAEKRSQRGRMVALPQRFRE